MASNSILTSVKKLCGVTEEQEEYDLDFVNYINSALTTLTQLGIGPAEGFMIEDKDSTWDEFIGTDINLNATKTVIAQMVQLDFDPPVSGVAIEAKKERIREQQWRLNVHRENLLHPVFYPDEDLDDDLVVDGGTI